MQEQERPRGRDHDESLAGRLDELTRPEMERVLERAIRIHAERSERHTFTREQVDQVASELGLPPEVVQRAIEEELTAAGDASTRPPLLGPRRLVSRTTVDASETETGDRVEAWLESEEGLRPAGRLADGVRWVPDSHWTTGARLALGSEGTRALRGMRETIHRVTPLADDRQVVELDVDTGAIRTGAGWTGAGVGAAGVAGGVGAAFGLDLGSDLGEFLMVAAPVAAAGAAAMVTVSRVWASSVRQGIERALDGIAHPDLYPRAAKRRRKRQGGKQDRSSAGRLVDDVSDALDRLLG